MTAATQKIATYAQDTKESGDCMRMRSKSVTLVSFRLDVVCRD